MNIYNVKVRTTRPDNTVDSLGLRTKTTGHKIMAPDEFYAHDLVLRYKIGNPLGGEVEILDVVKIKSGGRTLPNFDPFYEGGVIWYEEGGELKVLARKTEKRNHVLYVKAQCRNCYRYTIFQEGEESICEQCKYARQVNQDKEKGK